MGAARLSQPHLFQRGRQGWPLCGLGAARPLHRRTPRRVQTASPDTLINRARVDGQEEVHMKSIPIVAAAAAIAAGALAPQVAPAQAPGTTRTDLSPNDLSVSGREAIQVLVGFAP